jgi:hypothetical protein
MSLFRSWKYDAVQVIRRYAESHRDRHFIANDVIRWSTWHGLKPPPNTKQWGPALQEAQDLGYIKAEPEKVWAPKRRCGSTTWWRVC